MATIESMYWLAATVAGFDLFTEHNNLIYLFDPLSLVPDLSQSSTRKVLCWAVRLSSYLYNCDMLNRWSAPKMVCRLFKVPVLPSTNAETICWPTAEEIAQQQQKYSTQRPTDLVLSDGIWNKTTGSIWIPEKAEYLEVHLWIIAHTDPAGHRGRDTPRKVLIQHYNWNTLSQDVNMSIKACIHCLLTLRGKKVPSPFGWALHGTRPNDLLQFDYIEIGPSNAGPKYILMLRDDHSDYKWFFATHFTTVDNAALAFID